MEESIDLMSLPAGESVLYSMDNSLWLEMECWDEIMAPKL